MNDYNNAQIDYRERCKARIQRQLEISKAILNNKPKCLKCLCYVKCCRCFIVIYFYIYFL